MNKRMRAELFSRLSIFSIVSFFVLWTVLPVVWIFIMSVQPEINYILVPPRLRWVDVSPRWYLELLAQPEVALSLFNSFVVSISVTVLCLVFGALGAYPLARLNLPGKNIFLSLSIVSRMIPSMVLIIPIFLLLRTTGLLDTRLGLILVYTALLLPFVLWMLKNFLEQVPRGLEAAALMDGCTRLGALFRVMIPAIAPGVVATGAFAFIGAWNEFLFGLILTTSRAVPITVKLSGFVSSTYHSDTSIVAACGMLAVIPIFALLLILNRFIVRGMVEGMKY